MKNHTTVTASVSNESGTALSQLSVFSGGDDAESSGRFDVCLEGDATLADLARRVADQVDAIARDVRAKLQEMLSVQLDAGPGSVTTTAREAVQRIEQERDTTRRLLLEYETSSGTRAASTTCSSPCSRCWSAEPT